MCVDFPNTNLHPRNIETEFKSSSYFATLKNCNLKEHFSLCRLFKLTRNFISENWCEGERRASDRWWWTKIRGTERERRARREKRIEGWRGREPDGVSALASSPQGYKQPIWDLSHKMKEMDMREREWKKAKREKVFKSIWTIDWKDVNWPGVAHSLIAWRQMKQIKGLEVISGIELAFGSCFIRSPRRSQYTWRTPSLGWKNLSKLTFCYILKKKRKALLSWRKSKSLEDGQSGWWRILCLVSKKYPFTI